MITITFYTLCQINDLAQRCCRSTSPAYSQRHPDDDVTIIQEYNDGFKAVVRVDGREIIAYYAPCR